MKAIILAGGSGDRLWPLSRKNYPKQFIQFNNEKSMFQDAITRNIPYCDEFIIVAGKEYEEIIEGQLRQFQSVNYTLCMEEKSCGTTAAIDMALKLVDDDDTVFIVPADLIINGAAYSNHIYEARDKATEGKICLFGVVPDSSNNSYAYIRYTGDKVDRFIVHPSEEMAKSLFIQSDIYWNSGMIIALASTLRSEMDRLCTHLPDESDMNESLQSFDQAVLARSNLLSVIEFECSWTDISDFQSYSEYVGTSQENVIVSRCDDVDVINISSNQLVVVNGIDNAFVVNTPDAIFVTDKDKSNRIKDILKKNSDKAGKYDRSYIDNRPWGIREILKKEPGFRVRKITIFPGLKLSNHMHNKRNENYTVVSGVLTIELADSVVELQEGESYNIEPNVMHMLRNNTDENVIVVEVDTGAEIDEWDMVHNDEFDRRISSDKDSQDAMPDIFKLQPAYKDYLWGGSKLKAIYDKDTPYDITAESWELSAHPDGSSVITGGKFDGTDFREFIDRYKALVCGWKAEVFDRFPILIKFIDASNPLSVQIHPDDDYAFVNEGEFGKNEVWYVLDCESDAYLYVGLNRASTVDEIKDRIADNTITDILNKVPVKKGDVIFVPAGTIHAIGAGILACEIQQNSNSTYRLYDYDRKDKNGNTRQLHIDKALDVVDTSTYTVDTKGAGEIVRYDRSEQRLLCQCKYFEVKHYDIPRHEIIMIDDSSFKSILVISGKCVIECGTEKQEAKKGDSFFISAGRKRVHIYGQCELIVTNI